MKKYDVTALGELLIDFTDNGLSGQGNPLFEANPGGAPCNVLSMLSRLGKKTAFIGKVGDDMFGRQLTDAVKAEGIDISGLKADPKYHTTLAFVHTLAGGDREFSFLRDPGADMMLTRSEVNADIIRDSEIFHFGTLSSTHDGVREATRYAVETAKKSGVTVSFDPNLRELLWKSPDDARREIEYGLSKCDILKISDNELEFMTGLTDPDKAARMLIDQYGIPVVFATLGKSGSIGYCGNVSAGCDGFNVDTTETTGAGDTFCGCALNYILDHGMDLSEEEMYELLRYANAAAAIVTTRKGALRVMPTAEETEALLKIR